jgi:Acetyltransferase (GNAT) domain
MGCRVATVGFLVAQGIDRPHVVARVVDEASVAAAVYRHLLARRGEWSYLELVQQSAASILFPPPPEVDLSGYLVRQWPSLENCTIPVRWASLGDYAAAMSKKFRSNLGRQLNGLFDAGRLEAVSSADPADTPALLELYLGIEPHSWKAGTSATIARNPRRIAYFRSLLEARQPMRICIHLLLLDGVPIAGMVNGAFASGLYALHIVYDDRLSRFAPGSTMLMLGMRQAIAEGHAFFNLLSGFGYFKSRWLADSTPLHVAQIYRAGSPLYWRRLLGDWKRRLTPRVAPAARELFNPSRRAAAAVQPAALVPPALDAAHCERMAAQVAQLRGGRGEWLTSQQLAAILPIGRSAPERLSGRLAAPGRRGAASTDGRP